MCGLEDAWYVHSRAAELRRSTFANQDNLGRFRDNTTRPLPSITALSIALMPLR